MFQVVVAFKGCTAWWSNTWICFFCDLYLFTVENHHYSPPFGRFFLTSKSKLMEQYPFYLSYTDEAWYKRHGDIDLDVIKFRGFFWGRPLESRHHTHRVEIRFCPEKNINQPSMTSTNLIDPNDDHIDQHHQWNQSNINDINDIPIGSMWQVFLPSWMVDLYDKSR